MIDRERFSSSMIEKYLRKKIRENRGESYGQQWGSFDITSDIKPELREIAKSKGLKIEQILDITKSYEKFTTDRDAFSRMFEGRTIKTPKDNKCYFKEGFNAWVYRNREGQYWYYSSNGRDIYYLNVIDFFVIFTDKSFRKLKSDILEAFGFETEEEEGRRERKAYYLEIIKEVESFEKYKEDYPNTFEKVNTSLITLSTLSAKGIDSIIRAEQEKKGKHIFFASTGYLAKHIGKNKSTIVRHVNMLCLLGFIDKTSMDEIPKHLLNESIKRQGGNEYGDGRKSIINYYSINEINEELLEKAEEKAMILKEKNICTKTLTMRKVNKVFGEYEANRIYGNNKDITQKAISGIERRKIEKEMYEEYINE